MADCPTTKLMIVGDSTCGKTCTILRFANDAFSPTFISTIGIDFRSKIVTKSDGTHVRVQLWDTAGQERFKSVARSYYRGANGILVMCAINNKSSFCSVKSWVSDIKEQSSDVPVMLVANKIDLPLDQRVVSTQELGDLAQSLNVPYFEISAKTGQNVDELFTWFADHASGTKNTQLAHESHHACC